MLEIRKGLIGEENKILEVADSSFSSFRDDGFSFKSLIPRIYDNNLDFAPFHHVLLEDGNIKALAGNLINTIELDGKYYKYSLVGTVSTLKEASGKGYMKMVMESIDKENREEGVVFSALSGDRIRYKYYGYEIGPNKLIYFFDSSFKRHNKINNEIVIRKYQKEENKAYYELYKKYQSFNPRREEDFRIALGNASMVFGIYKENSLIGYFELSEEFKWVNEIALSNLSYLNSVVAYIMNEFNLAELKLTANPLNKALRDKLDSICSNSSYNSNINLKVYKMKEFLEYIIKLNLCDRYIANLNLCYKVDKDIIEINIVDNKLSVEYTNKPYSMEFTHDEFISYIFKLINNDNLLFPLHFDILRGDFF